MKRDVVLGIFVIVVALIAIFFGNKYLQARYDLSISTANLKAERDTVRVYRDSTQSLTTAAAVMQFQIPTFDVTDSLSKLQSALGMATRDLDLTVKALTKAEVAFQVVLADYTRLVEMTVLSPQGRPERLAAFTLEDTIANPLVEGEIVVTVPADTALDIELTTHLRPRPFTFTYALGCTPNKEAVAAFETPAGIVARPEKGQVDPVVCHGTRPSLFSAGLTITPGGVLFGGIIGAAIMLVLTGI